MEQVKTQEKDLFSSAEEHQGNAPQMSEKEKQQDKIEKMRRLRNKQIAIIKAQNEMLENAKRQVEEKFADDEDSIDKVTGLIDGAIAENIASGMEYLKASPSEIESAEYRQPSRYWVDKYERHLQSRGMTDEEMRRKDFAVAETVSTKKTRRPRKERKLAESQTEVKQEEPAQASVTIAKAEVKNEVRSDISYVKDVAKGYSPFDPNSVPDYVQYDVLTLPSKGQCYPHKKSTVPVSYLTAADENMIASPNLYHNGKITDLILKRKILDPDFDVDKMCQGDKDAIILWLRANAYGDEFPITTRNPKSGKVYNMSLKLSDFLSKYMDFDLVGDENGYFDYTLPSGVLVKFRIVPGKENADLKKRLSDRMGIRGKVEAYRLVRELDEVMEGIDDEEWKDIDETVDDLKDMMVDMSVDSDIDDEDFFTNAITDGMELMTVSINGNSDREYIRNFIANMRAADAKAYRIYVNDHQPGVDLSITINIPESDGGGSYDTFLRLDEYVFINA